MWQVLIEEKALEFINSLDKRVAENILKNLRLLKENPYPGHGQGDKDAIKGSSKTSYRMRTGNHRAFYLIEDNKKIARITEIMTTEAAHKKYGRM